MFKTSSYRIPSQHVDYRLPVVYQQIFEVLEEPFAWYEEPIVIEPERIRNNKAMVVKDILTMKNDELLSSVYKGSNASCSLQHS